MTLVDVQTDLLIDEQNLIFLIFQISSFSLQQVLCCNTIQPGSKISRASKNLLAKCIHSSVSREVDRYYGADYLHSTER